MTLTFERPGALERPTSDWTRDDAGRPWVLPDPAWTPEQRNAWSGTRAKPDGSVPYTRVTTFVEALLEGTALGRWKMRRVALGMGRRPDYVVAAAALTAEERDRAALNDLAEKALEAAGPNAADVGTALHSFTERIDRGEPLGFVPDQYAADLDAYREQVQRITWLHREERMVCDRLEVAGTPDGIGLVDEADPDGVVGVPRIVDLKTGNISYTAGKFSAQLGVYANSSRYDPATGERIPVPELSTRWGLVLHMPAGLGTAELRWLNIEHGWLGAQLCAPVRKWRAVGHGDLLRPLEAPEPRQVPDGKCAGRKRDGEPCTFKAVADGFCGRHQDQVGTDPDAAVNARTQEAMATVATALESVPEPLRVEQPATVVLEDEDPAPESPAVHNVVDERKVSGPHWYVASLNEGLCLNCRLERKHPDAQHLGVVPEPDSEDAADLDGTDDPITWCDCRPDEQCPPGQLCRRRSHLPDPRQPEPVEQNGNPRPHTSMGSPDDARDAARRAEDSLLEQVRACRTNGELAVLYEQTGNAWTPAVRAAASEQRQQLESLAQAERVDAALLAAIAACRSVPELKALAQSYPLEQWTDEAKQAARKAAAELPPF